jgi:hypothetical protein
MSHYKFPRPKPPSRLMLNRIVDASRKAEKKLPPQADDQRPDDTREKPTEIAE